jgi:hypothetical protein
LPFVVCRRAKRALGQRMALPHNCSHVVQGHALRCRAMPCGAGDKIASAT